MHNPILKKFRAAGLTISLCFAALVLTSCNPLGYSGETLQPKGIKTLYVPMPTRAEKVYLRDFEQSLHKNLIAHLQMRTKYSISKRPNADAELTCEIKEIIRATTSINPDTGLPRETEITFIVGVKMKNLATGNTIFEEPSMRVATTYFPYGNFNEDTFRASEDVFNRLARQIIDRMDTGW